jgi:NAD(P)H-dependent flavin oxidoreductase YrpB (nitropropane dioxygenase family)
LKSDDAAHERFTAAVRAADVTTSSLYAGQGVGALDRERTAAEVLAHFASADTYLRAAANSLTT